jgi:positive regulator of sigma E activity
VRDNRWKWVLIYYTPILFIIFLTVIFILPPLLLNPDFSLILFSFCLGVGITLIMEEWAKFCAKKIVEEEKKLKVIKSEGNE